MVVFDSRSISESLIQREALYRNIFAEDGFAVFHGRHRFDIGQVEQAAKKYWDSIKGK